MKMPEGLKTLRWCADMSAAQSNSLRCANCIEDAFQLMKEMAEALEYYAEDQRYYNPHNVNPDAAMITLNKFKEWK